MCQNGDDPNSAMQEVPKCVIASCAPAVGADLKCHLTQVVLRCCVLCCALVGMQVPVLVERYGEQLPGLLDSQLPPRSSSTAGSEAERQERTQ
jgi:hypothetical protein